MNSKDYKEIKDLLVQLEQKIEALLDPAVDHPDEQVFELDSQPEMEQESEPETEPETVGDLFSGFAQRITLADSLAKTKNGRPLKEVIPLNDRFLYEKVLFNQDRALYDKTLTNLQDVKTIQQAEAYLAEHFPHWELSSPAVQKFLTQLEDVF
ncbi:MAG: hypothetical protein WC128_01195 [Bacteroidales bacterium]